MSAPAVLPARFAALEPFAAYWAVPSLSRRDTCRLESSVEQRLAFYDAAKDLAPAMLEHLEGKCFAAYDDADHRLMDLLLALIHVTLAVEVERNEEHLHARGAWLMPFVKERASPRDLAAGET